MSTSRTLDPPALQRWLGRTETREAVLEAGPLERLAATIGRGVRPLPGDPLPPLRHWLYFLDATPRDALGRDGHAAPGDFIPPVALPRRMWAGGRIEAIAPLHVGDRAERRSEIVAIEPKRGRSGALCFVTVRHTISVHGATRMVESHDIVYRDDPTGEPTPGAIPTIAPPDRSVQSRFTVDPVLLFRFSALTFNGHRIHYDRDYARQVEGYPGLVVHAPLIAMLLADAAALGAPDALRRFDYRAVAPCFDDATLIFDVAADAEGRDATASVAGRVVMRARAD